MRARFLAVLLPILALAEDHHDHGHEHDSTIADFQGDWASWHMYEEHRMENFDAGAFFSIHDFSETHAWSPDDVRRMYGLDHDTSKNVPKSKGEEVTREIFRLFDSNHNGVIERAEFTDNWNKGVRLPDFGLGPGHHADDEYEYEIHHFEKYHDENTKLEDLTHPEDIEHFAKHEAEEKEQERLAQQKQNGVILANIPQKFLRKQQ